MRQTDQYAQWQRIRQNNDPEAKRLAELILARSVLLQDRSSGKSINWQKFDQLTAQLYQAGLTLPISLEIQANAKGSPASLSPPPQSPSGVEKTSPTPANTLLVEENQLVLSVVCPAVGLKQEVVGYGDGETTLLPLGEVARALDFDLTVDAQKKTATGWFIAEDRTVTLDAGKRTIKIDGKTYPWNDDTIAVGEDEIFVDSKTLSEWFPIDFAVSSGEMTVTVAPREELPLQTQYEREKQRQGLGKKEDTSLKYDPIQSPYELYSFPVMDVSLSSGVKTTNNETDIQLGHSILAEGDLAHMGAKLFASGTDESPLNHARFTLEKLDQDAKLLGPMHASQVAVGDVAPVSLPILASGQTERGVLVSNGDIHRSRDFDTTRFEGNMQPGWDVELYQNGNLVESVRVGADGRYQFENIPVFFGPNAFQVLAHGPQGQRRIAETKNINVGSGMLKAGVSEYNLSATQRKKTTFGINDEIGGKGGGSRVTGNYTHGLTDHLSATAGVSSVEFDDKSIHNYMQAGLNGTLSTLYGEVDAIQDSQGGSGYSMQGQTALGPVNLSTKHEIFSDFIEEDQPDKFLQSRTSFGINGATPEFLFVPRLSSTLSRQETKYTDSETALTSFRLAGQVNRVHLSNVINWNDSAATSLSGALVDGDFQASGSVGRGRVTAGLKYDLGGKDEISQYKLSGFWPLAQDISVGASLLHETTDIKGTAAELNLALDLGKVTLSPKVTFDSEGNYGGFLTVSFSLGQDPVSKDMTMQSKKRTGTGSTTALVYHDANNNSIFDQGDTPLPEVKVVARQSRQTAQTNDKGVAQLTNLSASAPTDVEIEAKSLEDPYWQPSTPGVAITPRSGSVQALEFPVVTTGEVDGTIYAENSNGVKEPLSNVQLEIRDDKAKKVQTTTTENDGFYLFEKVFPGTYTLRVLSEDAKLKEAAASLQKEIVIGNDGTIARGNNLILRAPEAKGRNKTNAATPSSAPEIAENKKEPSNTVTAPDKTAPPSLAALSPKPVKSVKEVEQKTPASPPAGKPAKMLAAVTPISAQHEPTEASRPVTSLSIAPLTLMQTADQFLAEPKREESLGKGSGLTGSTPESHPSIPPHVATHGNQSRTEADAPLMAPAKKVQEKAFGVHLASYKSIRSAQAGIKILAKQLTGIVSTADFTISEVDLGKEKGIFYRVTCGQFTQRKDADRLATRMQPQTEYARSIQVKTVQADNKPIASLPGRRMQMGPDPAAIAAKYAAMQQRR